MACGSGSCGSGGCGSGGGGCSSSCASRLNVYDWLDNMLPPGETESNNIYEVRFKSTRKGYYRNVNALDLYTGDCVVVESDRGFDVGMVTMGGEMTRIQMKRKRINERFIPKIYRVASEDDLKKLEDMRSRELSTMMKAREIALNLRLNMKVSDIEYQADGAKAIFYYTAEQRIDFRDLIKTLAGEFKIRIEMRQIGLRQEAGLVGGVGSCGRELCCSSWLTEFKSVNTYAARYQNISLNPTKITGLCGRLKCCLNYELETYLDALKDIPDIRELRTEIGVAYLQKTDIFLRKMWFSYAADNNWTMLTVEQVLELADLNKQGVFPPTLIAGESADKPKRQRSLGAGEVHDFVDVVGQSNLNERMDRDDRKKKKKKPKPNPGEERASNPNRREQNAATNLMPSADAPPKERENREPRQPRENREQRDPNRQRPENREQRDPNRQRPENREQRDPNRQRPENQQRQRPPQENRNNNRNNERPNNERRNLPPKTEGAPVENAPNTETTNTTERQQRRDRPNNQQRQRPPQQRDGQNREQREGGQQQREPRPPRDPALQNANQNANPVEGDANKQPQKKKFKKRKRPNNVKPKDGPSES